MLQPWIRATRAALLMIVKRTTMAAKKPGSRGGANTRSHAPLQADHYHAAQGVATDVAALEDGVVVELWLTNRCGQALGKPP